MITDLDTPAPAQLGTAPAAGAARRRRIPSLVTTTGAVAVLTVVLCVVSYHAVAGNSDGATVVLEGQSMSAGNLLLHHWALSLDSFWSVDALFYAVVVLVTGVQPLVLHLVPALVAALVVVSGAALARTGHRGAPAVAAALSVGALLALPAHVLAVYFLQGPLHVGTVLWCLLAFVGLRSGRWDRGWLAAVILFAAGMLGDAQVVAMGMAPAVLAGGAAAWRTRRWRRGLSTVAAPVAALALAGAVRGVTVALGSFTVASSHPTASGAKLLGNVGLVATWGARMLGVGSGGFGYGGVPAGVELVHVVGLVVVVAGVVAAALALVGGLRAGHRSALDAAPAPEDGWRVDDLVLFAFFGDLVVFVTLTYTDAPDFSRYLTGAVVFGAVLAGRLVARLVAGAAPARRRRLAGAGAVVVALFGAGLGLQLGSPQPTRPYAALGAFLEAHHLHRGIGDYWSASITTVSTHGEVLVRPVIADGLGRIGRYDRQSDGAWYARQDFGFLVYDTARPWGGITTGAAQVSFGGGERTYDVGTFRVLVWDHPLRVAAGPGG